MIDPKLKLVPGDVVAVRLFVHTTCAPDEDSICLAADMSGSAGSVRVSRKDATLTTTVLRPGDEVTTDGPNRTGIIRHLIGDQAWVRWADKDSVVNVEWLTRTRTAVDIIVEDEAAAALDKAE